MHMLLVISEGGESYRLDLGKAWSRSLGADRTSLCLFAYIGHMQFSFQGQHREQGGD